MVAQTTSFDIPTSAFAPSKFTTLPTSLFPPSKFTTLPKSLFTPKTNTGKGTTSSTKSSTKSSAKSSTKRTTSQRQSTTPFAATTLKKTTRQPSTHTTGSPSHTSRSSAAPTHHATSSSTTSATAAAGGHNKGGGSSNNHLDIILPVVLVVFFVALALIIGCLFWRRRRRKQRDLDEKRTPSMNDDVSWNSDLDRMTGQPRTGREVGTAAVAPVSSSQPTRNIQPSSAVAAPYTTWAPTRTSEQASHGIDTPAAVVAPDTARSSGQASRGTEPAPVETARTQRYYAPQAKLVDTPASNSSPATAPYSGASPMTDSAAWLAQRDLQNDVASGAPANTAGDSRWTGYSASSSGSDYSASGAGMAGIGANHMGTRDYSRGTSAPMGSSAIPGTAAAAVGASVFGAATAAAAVTGSSSRSSSDNDKTPRASSYAHDTYFDGTNQGQSSTGNSLQTPANRLTAGRSPLAAEPMTNSEISSRDVVPTPTSTRGGNETAQRAAQTAFLGRTHNPYRPSPVEHPQSQPQDPQLTALPPMHSDLRQGNISIPDHPVLTSQPSDSGLSTGASYLTASEGSVTPPAGHESSQPVTAGAASELEANETNAPRWPNNAWWSLPETESLSWPLGEDTATEARSAPSVWTYQNATETMSPTNDQSVQDEAATSPANDQSGFRIPRKRVGSNPRLSS